MKKKLSILSFTSPEDSSQIKLIAMETNFLSFLYYFISIIVSSQPFQRPFKPSKSLYLLPEHHLSQHIRAQMPERAVLRLIFYYVIFPRHETNFSHQRMWPCVWTVFFSHLFLKLFHEEH